MWLPSAPRSRSVLPYDTETEAEDLDIVRTCKNYSNVRLSFSFDVNQLYTQVGKYLGGTETAADMILWVIDEEHIQISLNRFLRSDYVLFCLVRLIVIIVCLIGRFIFFIFFFLCVCVCFLFFCFAVLGYLILNIRAKNLCKNALSFSTKCALEERCTIFTIEEFACVLARLMNSVIIRSVLPPPAPIF